MFFPKLSLTDAGRALIIKALSGETLTFTKLAIGTGEDPGEVAGLTDLVSGVVDMQITSIEKGDGVVKLEGSFDNSALNAGIYARELGVFAEDPDIGEILYAYANAGEFPAYIPTDSSNSFERITLRVLVAVGDAENIEAVIGEFAGYATKEELSAHTLDKNNPHGVTAEQVGLGNVPNVSTNNQTPTFSTSSKLANIISGETMSVILGKVRTAVSSLISHLSAKNPHEITADMIGAGKIVTGTYTGSGKYGSGNKNTLTFTAQPKLLIVMPISNSSHADYGGFVALRGVTILRAGGLSDDVSNSESQLRLTWGTTVSWYNNTDQYFQQNASGWTYAYLAIL